MLRASARVSPASRAGRWAPQRCAIRWWLALAWRRCGVVRRFLRHPSCGCCPVPPGLPVLPVGQRQNRPDRCLQHQPAHLPLQLPAGRRSGLLRRGWFPHPVALGSAQQRRQGPAGGSPHQAGVATDKAKMAVSPALRSAPVVPVLAPEAGRRWTLWRRWPSPCCANRSDVVPTDAALVLAAHELAEATQVAWFAAQTLEAALKSSTRCRLSAHRLVP